MFKSFQSRPLQICCLRGGLIKTKYEVRISYGIALHLCNPFPHADEFNASLADNFKHCDKREITNNEQFSFTTMSYL